MISLVFQQQALLLALMPNHSLLRLPLCAVPLYVVPLCTVVVEAPWREENPRVLLCVLLRQGLAAVLRPLLPWGWHPPLQVVGGALDDAMILQVVWQEKQWGSNVRPYVQVQCGLVAVMLLGMACQSPHDLNAQLHSQRLLGSWGSPMDMAHQRPLLMGAWECMALVHGLTLSHPPLRLHQCQ